MELEPGKVSTYYFQRYLVNTTDSPQVSLRVESPTGLACQVHAPLRAVTVGPAANGIVPGNLHELIVSVSNSAGETASAVLPVIVRASSTPHVVLRFKPDAPIQKAVAAGDFNGWDQGKTPLLDPDGDGTYEARLQVSPGRYAYKFVVDGRWIPDPSNRLRSEDGFGGENTILVVEGPAAPPRLIPRNLSGARATFEYVAAPSGREPARVLAWTGGTVLSSRWNGTVLEVDLPADGKEHLVKVVVSDAGGALSAPVRFHAGPSRSRWEDDVMYFAFLDRFANGDSSNDRPVADPLVPWALNWQGGDFAGLKAKIEEGYFGSLGVTAIWISPFFENTNEAVGETQPPPRRCTGYHGYWPVSERIEPRYGTEEDLKALVDAAHARGIKVLFDMVYNHVHRDHPLVRENPELIVPLELPDGRQNIGLWNEFPLSTWFGDFLPDINYGVPAAIRYQLDLTERWVRKTGVDGFRLDAVKHVPHPFWWALRNRLARIEAERGTPFYLVGETIDSRKRIMEFVSPAGLDGQFDFPLYWGIKATFGQGTDGFDRVEAELARGEREYPEDALHSTLLGNHDFSRFMAYADNAFAGNRDEKEAAWSDTPVVRVAASYEKLKMAWTFLFSNPGLPMIYYGDEIGMTGAHDPDNRRPMRFGDDVMAPERSVMDHVARLTAARRAHPALSRGPRRSLLVERDRYAYLRTWFGDASVSAWNRSNAPKTFTLDVAPDLTDGTVLRDVTGGAVENRAVVSGGRLVFDAKPMSSVLWVRASE